MGFTLNNYYVPERVSWMENCSNVNSGDGVKDSKATQQPLNWVGSTLAK